MCYNILNVPHNAFEIRISMTRKTLEWKLLVCLPLKLRFKFNNVPTY